MHDVQRQSIASRWGGAQEPKAALARPSPSPSLLALRPHAPPRREAPSQARRAGPSEAAVQLQRRLLELARQAGFVGGLYMHVGHALRDRGAGAIPARFVSSEPLDRVRFDEEALTADPIARRAAASHHPFVWTTADAPDLTEAERQFLRRLRARGVCAGVAAPVQDYAAGPAYVSLYGLHRDCAGPWVEDRAAELAFIASTFHLEAKAALPSCNLRSDGAALTTREIGCLRLAALGHTVAETAVAFGITPRTVEFHLKNAADKLGAPNKLRAVTLAISHGLIEA